MPSRKTLRSIVGSLFVHGTLDRATLTGGRKSTRKLKLLGDDELPSEDTFDKALRWLKTNELVRWEPSTEGRHHELSLGPAWGYAVGVVLGHESVRCGIADARAAPLSRDGEELFDTVPTSLLDGENAFDILETAAVRVAAIVGRSGVAHDQLRGITLALPSPVDLEGNVAGGKVMRGLNGRGGPRESFRRALEQVGLGGLRIDIDNDANVAALGEWHIRHGTPTPPTTLVAVKTSGGIGGALVDKLGIVQRGATGTAGELGHIPVDVTQVPTHDADLPPLDLQAACRQCGGAAHLECYVPASAIIKRLFSDARTIDASERYKEMFTALYNPEDPDHRRTCQAVYDSGWILGRALIPIREFADPDIIVIVGRMRSANDVFTGAVIEGLATAPRMIEKMPKVVASEDTRTGILGAIRNTLQNQPPLLKPLLQGRLEELRRDMQVGPRDWQMAARMLGPSIDAQTTSSQH